MERATQKLYKGDCLEVMDTLIADGVKVDAIITDPPYNIAQNNNFHTMGRKGIDFGEWDKGFNQIEWLKRIPKLLDKNGSVVIFNTFQNLTDTVRYLEKQGLVYKDFLVMEKSNPMPRNRDRRYINACEYALFMVVKNSKWVFNRQSDKYDSNVMKTSVVSGKEKTSHTTQKPINIISELIKRHTNQKDLVIDPFMGSGTTGVACKNLNRNFIGIELNDKYFEIAENRIHNQLL